jgi:hypothetical protein
VNAHEGVAVIGGAREKAAHLRCAQALFELANVDSGLLEGGGIGERSGELQVLLGGQEIPVELQDERARLLDPSSLAKQSLSGQRVVPEGREGYLVS